MFIDCLNYIWLYFESFCSPFHLFVNCTMLFHFIAFWFNGIFFMFLDLTHFPDFLYNYKIQKKKHHGWLSYKKAIKQAIISQIIGYIFAVFLFYIAEFCGYGIVITKDIPEIHIIIARFICFVLIEEIAFYYTHYMLHSKYLYKRIHSFHHQFTAPISIIAIYSHPIEHILSLLPILIGPVLLCSHVVEIWLWLFFATITTTIHHSGYNFPLIFGAKEHDYHHEAFIYNYGVLGILDWIHGTNGESKRDKCLSK